MTKMGRYHPKYGLTLYSIRLMSLFRPRLIHSPEHQDIPSLCVSFTTAFTTSSYFLTPANTMPIPLRQHYVHQHVLYG